jgi:GntR family transcriptional repressor for pyruvate dehydrogenase complex
MNSRDRGGELDKMDTVRGSRGTGLKRQNLSQALSEEILARIRAGEWVPGEKLPSERELMEEFKIGRSAVREGIQGLVRLGVLDVRPGIGTTVVSLEGNAALDNEAVSAMLSDHTVDELYELRMLLEVDAAGRGAERATPSDRQALEEAFRRYRKAAEAGDHVYEYDVEFHRMVAKASGNSLYTKVLELTADRLLTVRRETDKIPGAIEVAVRGHEEVTKAILRSDARGARKAMREHIEAGREAIEGIRRFKGKGRS